jgi:hypothetical protein
MGGKHSIPGGDLGLDFSSLKLLADLWLPDLKIRNVCCFQLLNLWSFGHQQGGTNKPGKDQNSCQIRLRVENLEKTEYHTAWTLHPQKSSFIVGDIKIFQLLK